MQKIKAYYSIHHQNFGDILNPVLMDRIFSCPVVRSRAPRADLFGIGSILNKLMPEQDRFFSRLIGRFQSPCRIWTSGFIMPPRKEARPIRSLQVHAVRGRLTLEYLRSITGTPLEVPLGDGGLLAGLLLERPVPKKYSVGIIPHYHEYDRKEYWMLADRIPRSTVIPIIGDPWKTLEAIASCETVLSSSLHGLIGADSLGIPNLHLDAGDALTGGNFKYRDYYSAFGLEHAAGLPVEKMLEQVPDPEQIAAQYPIRREQVEEIQKNLIAAWPYAR